MPDALLAGLIAVPVLLLVLLRVNAALVFLSLSLGAVLVQFVGSDVVSIVTGASTQSQVPASTVKLILLVLPAVLTLLFMIRTVKPSGRLLNILPAIGAGFLTALLVTPLLPPGLQYNVVHSGMWQQIRSLQSSIVAASTLVCLLFLWLQRPKPHEAKHSKH